MLKVEETFIRTTTSCIPGGLRTSSIEQDDGILFTVVDTTMKKLETLQRYFFFYFLVDLRMVTIEFLTS